MKKLALTSVFANVTYNDKNHRGLEAMFIKQMLEERENASIDIVGYKNRNVKDLDFYVNYPDTDFSEYDGVLIQLSTPNFFGGVMGEHSEKICNDLAKYKGKIFILVNDPRIPPLNYAEVIHNRFQKCGESIQGWNRIIEEATYLFPGKDISKFLGWQPKHWMRLDWFTYIFKQRFTSSGMIDLDSEVLEVPEKEWDIVYYGDRRGSFREGQIRKYFSENDDMKKLLIGYKTDKVRSEFIKKLSHSDLMDKLDSVKVSLIIGDEEHLDNVTTYRFYETLASTSLAAISIEYDPNRELIEDPVLRDLLYVDSPGDIKRLSDSYSIDLINRQRKELKRIFDMAG